MKLFSARKEQKIISKLLKLVVLCILVGALVLTAATSFSLKPLPTSLSLEKTNIKKSQVLDRNGIPLTTTYQNRWNVHDHLPIYEIPDLLKRAFIYSEDKRFYSHNGIDWLARAHALFQNLAALKAVRGASTITEQVVRMINPRPRTVWSRWLEGIEGNLLEKRFSKEEIFEFYLNQTPYAAMIKRQATILTGI